MAGHVEQHAERAARRELVELHALHFVAQGAGDPVAARERGIGDGATETAADARDKPCFHFDSP